MLFVAIWIEKGFGFIVPGFIPGPYGKIAEYTPTGIEIGVTLGIWALGAFVFTIFARTIKFRKIYESYSKAIDFKLPKEKREEDGKKLALFNSAGHLELAVYKSNPLTVGSASSLFGLDYRDPITIKFD